MIKFLKNLFYFILVFIAVIGVGVWLPPTPRAATAHLSSAIDKDLLLKNAPSPRLILIGGSNLSMSLNSQLLKDSLGYHPVNTGLSASIGLLYMLDHSLQYVRAGDLVVVAPEYSQFYDDLAIGTEDLIRVILDNSPADIFELRLPQFLNGFKYIPKYALSKFKISEYFLKEQDLSQVYLRTSFNQYGDMDKHWPLARREFGALDPMRSASFDEGVLDYLQQFKESVERKGATVCLTFPAFQEKAFDDGSIEIAFIAQQLTKKGFTILGNPLRYKMPDSVMFDTPYHLTIDGVITRTQLLIEDIKIMQRKIDLMSMTPLN